MAWCGIATYAPGIGMIGHASMGIKSPCGVGAWTAGGLLHFFPTNCDCGALPGAVTFASGGELFKRAKDSPEHPLVKGPAFGKTRAVAAGAGDWPAYRADALHRGSSAVPVSAKGALAWTWRPEKPFAFSKHYSQHGFDFDERPVPPVIAAGRVFAAGSDGVVRAHGLKDGQPLWSATRCGPILGSPAFLDGLLFVPSLDGNVYALDAATGGLAWQRRLAPIDRRIHLFGKLAATWPVLSLVAREGRVYAVAGYLRGNGAKAFCLDAPTGEIVWQHWSEPEVVAKGDVPLDSHGFGGQIALIKGNLWAAGLQSVPMVLDAKTGEPRIPEADEKMEWFFRKGNDAVAHHLTSLGQDIVNLDDRAILIGGGMLFENHNVRDAKNSRANFKLFPIDGEGRMLLDVARLSSRVLDTARLAPAYDDTGLVFVARYEKEGGDRKVQVGTAGLNFWDKSAFIERGLKLQKQPAVVMPEGGKGQPKVEARDIFDVLPYAEGVWSKPEVMANAVALAANAVVSAEATGWDAPKQSWDKERMTARAALMTVEGWQLAARDRKDGAVLWSVPLPDEPLFNGLAVAPDGTVVVTLRDGSLVCVAKTGRE
jgi:outer membrane protein assembly factor BamB